jgi:hypothetical protein
VSDETVLLLSTPYASMTFSVQNPFLVTIFSMKVWKNNPRQKTLLQSLKPALELTLRK